MARKHGLARTMRRISVSLTNRGAYLTFLDALPAVVDRAAPCTSSELSVQVNRADRRSHFSEVANLPARRQPIDLARLFRSQRGHHQKKTQNLYNVDRVLRSGQHCA